MQPLSRRLVAAAGAVVAVLGLAACEKPTPIVTIQSGTNHVFDEAFSYCFEGQDPEVEPGQEGACRTDADREPRVLAVDPGNQVGISVDVELAEEGWFIALTDEDGQTQRLATTEGHYSSFEPDFNSSPTFRLEVRKLDEPVDGAEVRGIWLFTIVPDVEV